jgi:uncharacterized protein (DUF849 family)
MVHPARKIIITCAITGSIHTPSMSPHLPLTPAQIAEEAIEAARAGAAVLHLHAREPQDGSPSFDPAVFRDSLPQIHRATNAVINITTGGSHTMTLEQRLAAAIDVAPEMASCNMGSMNFGYFQVLDKLKEFKHGSMSTLPARASAFSATPSPTSSTSCGCWAGSTARASSSSATTSGTSTR